MRPKAEEAPPSAGGFRGFEAEEAPPTLHEDNS